MPACAIITCRARSTTANSSEGFSYHRFPKAPDLKEKWMKVTGRENWMPTKYSCICSKHFTEADYEIDKKRRKLQPGAIPTEHIRVTYGSQKHILPSPKADSEVDLMTPATDENKLLSQRRRLAAALKLEKMKVRRFREQNRRKDKKIATLYKIIFELNKKLQSKCDGSTRDDTNDIEESIMSMK